MIRSGTRRWWAVGAALPALVVVPMVVGAQEADGFDAYIQSGTCAAPTDDLRVQLRSDGDHDVAPYVAKGPDGEAVVLGYYGSSEVPGFGFATIYTDQDFSLVVTDTAGGDPVACGDILEPDADRFAEAGTAVVQLLPVEGSGVEGMAVIQRTRLERELDVTPTRVRIILSTGVDTTASSATAVGYDGFIQSGSCDAPTDRLRVDLKSFRGGHDVRPFLAAPTGSGQPVTVAYHGAPGVPGFGFASAYTDQSYSLVITDEAGDPAGCGDILQPDDDDLARAGLALVQIVPTGDDGVQGYALIERTPLQRELDVTPTRVRILLFAPPATT